MGSEGPSNLTALAGQLNDLGLVEERSTQEVKDVSCKLGECCPICRQEIELRDLATIPECGHNYCVKDPCTCPQCKCKTSSIHCFRELDGSVTDHMRKESLCLLRRAKWFLDDNKEVELSEGAYWGHGSPDEDYEYEDDYGYDDDDVPSRGAERFRA